MWGCWHRGGPDRRGTGLLSSALGWATIGSVVKREFRDLGYPQSDIAGEPSGNHFCLES